MNGTANLSDDKKRLYQEITGIGFDSQLQQIMLEGIETLSDEQTQKSLEKLESANQRLPQALQQAFDLGLLSPQHELFVALRQDDDAETVLALLLDGKSKTAQAKRVDSLATYASTQPEPDQRQFAALLLQRLGVKEIELNERETLMLGCLQFLQDRRQPVTWRALQAILTVFKVNDRHPFPQVKTGTLQIIGAEALYQGTLDRWFVISQDELKVSCWFELLQSLKLIKTTINIDEQAIHQLTGLLDHIQQSLGAVNRTQENIGEATKLDYQPQWTLSMKFTLSCLAVIRKVSNTGNFIRYSDIHNPRRRAPAKIAVKHPATP